MYLYDVKSQPIFNLPGAQKGSERALPLVDPIHASDVETRMSEIFCM